MKKLIIKKIDISLKISPNIGNLSAMSIKSIQELPADLIISICHEVVKEEDIVKDKVILSTLKLSSPISYPLLSLIKQSNIDDKYYIHKLASSCKSRISKLIQKIDNDDKNINRLASSPSCSQTVQLVAYKRLDKYFTDKLVSKNYLVKKNRSLSYESILNFYNKIPKNKRWFYNQKIVSKNEHIK